MLSVSFHSIKIGTHMTNINQTTTNEAAIREAVNNKSVLTSVAAILEEAITSCFGTAGRDKNAYFAELCMNVRITRKPSRFTVLPELMALLVGDRNNPFQPDRDIRSSKVLEQVMSFPNEMFGPTLTDLKSSIFPPSGQLFLSKNHAAICHHLRIAQWQGTLSKSINTIAQRSAQKMLVKRQNDCLALPRGGFQTFSTDRTTFDIASRDEHGDDCVVTFDKKEVAGFINTILTAMFIIDDTRKSVFVKNNRPVWVPIERVLGIDLRLISDEIARTNQLVGKIFSGQISPLDQVIEYGYLNFSDAHHYIQYVDGDFNRRHLFDMLMSIYVFLVAAKSVEPEGTPLHRSRIDPSMFIFSDGMGGEYTALPPETAAASAQKPVKSKPPAKPALTKRDTIKNSKAGKR